MFEINTFLAALGVQKKKFAQSRWSLALDQPENAFERLKRKVTTRRLHGVYLGVYVVHRLYDKPESVWKPYDRY